MCVVPVCRSCHRAYDEGRLDLLPYLEPSWRAQLGHAVAHLGVVGALRRISGSHSVAPPVRPPIEHQMPEVLSEGEITALIAACPLHPVGIRNRALIATMWCCGLRTAEALELAPASLDLDSLTLEVCGRTLGLDRQTGSIIWAWLESRRGLAVAGGPLFCTLSGGPLASAYVRGLFPRLSRRAGLARPVTPRLLRNAYAAELRRRGTSLAVLSAALGHSAPWVTARHLRRIGAEWGVDDERY